MDSLLIFTQLLLSALGVLGVATGSGDFIYLREQMISIFAGLLITFMVSRLSPKTIVKLSPIAYISVLIMLGLVLVIGLSPDGSDSKRWLSLPFGFTIQPSELMKVTVIAYLTAFFYNHLGKWELWRPTLVIGFATALIMLEPNVSTTFFIFALAFTIMLAAGTSFTRLLSISVSAALLATLIAGTYLSQFGYIQERIGVFFFKDDATLAQGAGYQASQAEKTLVKAGFFGIGPGRPVRVPESYTDMVAIPIAQALGLTGIASLIIAYLIIAVRGIRIASLHHGPGSLLAAGATTYICGQAALNLLVSSGYLPVTGVVLPFVSHGVNNLISVSIAMGFLHSAYRQFRKEGIAV
jgi:cell division protein FtsW